MPIRHADASRDAEACARIYSPYVLDTAISFEETPPSADEMERRMQDLGARFPWLVAEDDEEGTVAGYAHAAEHRARAAYRWSVDVTVYVERGARGRGLGRALYGALLPLLRAQGFRMACAGITLPNDASVALHELFGFELVGIHRAIGWKAGAWRDVGWWQLELGSLAGEPPPEPAPPMPDPLPG